MDRRTRPGSREPGRLVSQSMPLAERLAQLHAATQQGGIIQLGPTAIEESGQEPRIAPHAALHRLLGEREAHPWPHDGEGLAANRLMRAPHRIIIVPEDDLGTETLVRQAGVHADERAWAVFAARDSELSERRSRRDLRMREAVPRTLDAATEVDLVAGRRAGGVHELHPHERVAADATEHR